LKSVYENEILNNIFFLDKTSIIHFKILLDRINSVPQKDTRVNSHQHQQVLNAYSTIQAKSSLRAIFKQKISVKLVVSCIGLLSISILSMKKHTSDDANRNIVKPDVGPPSTQKKSERSNASTRYSYRTASIHISEHGCDWS
jgi:hypothetical protein